MTRRWCHPQKLPKAPDGLERTVAPVDASYWESIRALWTELFVESGCSSPFLSPLWIETWLAHFGRDVDAHLIIWRKERDCVGCVLIGIGAGHVGPFRVQQGFVNASGAGVMAEHNDVLTLPDYRDLILRDIATITSTISVDQLAIVGASDALFQGLRQHWPTDRWQGYNSESPYVDLRAVRQTGGDYLRHLSSNTRAQIRRSMRLYEQELGPPKLDEATQTVDALTFLDELVALHRERWSARGEAGGFTNRTIQFHQDLIRASFTAQDSTRLRTHLARLRYGTTTIGLVYHLVLSGRVHFFQSGFSYSQDRRLKPGLVTHYHSIVHCMSEGHVEYDFLGGEATSVRYKRSLSTATRVLWWVELPKPTIKMSVYDTLRRWKQRLGRKYVP